MLQIAANWIVQEKKDLEATKKAYMAEHCPSPNLSGDQAALMVRDMIVCVPARGDKSCVKFHISGLSLLASASSLKNQSHSTDKFVRAVLIPVKM